MAVNAVNWHVPRIPHQGITYQLKCSICDTKFFLMHTCTGVVQKIRNSPTAPKLMLACFPHQNICSHSFPPDKMNALMLLPTPKQMLAHFPHQNRIVACFPQAKRMLSCFPTKTDACTAFPHQNRCCMLSYCPKCQKYMQSGRGTHGSMRFGRGKRASMHFSRHGLLEGKQAFWQAF